jgi:Fe2+ or Zn2+ uptake regulation protein
MLTKKEASARLRAAGLRVTEPRIAVIRALEGKRTHPTVPQVHALVQVELPRIPEITVYRTLNTLSQAGLLVGIHGSSRGWRCDPDTTQHAHAVCRECGEVWDMPIESQVVFGPSPEGFLTAGTEVTLFGLCRKCRPPLAVPSPSESAEAIGVEVLCPQPN